MVWAGAVVLVVPHLPLYSSAGASADGWSHSTTLSLVEVNGAGPVYRFLLIPFAAAFLALLPLPRRYRRLAGVVAAVLAGCAMLVGIASVGLFFLPSVAALAYAAIRDRQQPTDMRRDTADEPG